MSIKTAARRDRPVKIRRPGGDSLQKTMARRPGIWYNTSEKNRGETMAVYRYYTCADTFSVPCYLVDRQI